MSLSRRQKVAYSLGLSLNVIVVFILLHPQYSSWHAHGPIQSGHTDIECNACHQKSSGTLRQQLQAKVQFLLGNREENVHVATRPVSNTQCLACHARDNDNHPVHRFNEPRFAKVRTKLMPQTCLGCHMEHTGKRVTQNIDICQNCHEDLKIKQDPITTSHYQLVKQQKWHTCLGCHDFHGNHIMTLPDTLTRLISKESIEAYFSDGESPYSQQKHHKAKKKLNET